MNVPGSMVMWRRPWIEDGLTVACVVSLAALVYVPIAVLESKPHLDEFVTLVGIVSIAGLLVLRTHFLVTLAGLVWALGFLFAFGPIVVLGLAFGGEESESSPVMLVFFLALWGICIVVTAGIIALLAKGIGAATRLGANTISKPSEPGSHHRFEAGHISAFLAYVIAAQLIALWIALPDEASLPVLDVILDPVYRAIDAIFSLISFQLP